MGPRPNWLEIAESAVWLCLVVVCWPVRASELTLLPLLSGTLAVGHRPPLRSLRALKAAGFTHVATVLSEAEGAITIGDKAKSSGLNWIWIALGSTKNLPARRKPEVMRGLEAMRSALEHGGRIYLHCSAGIHRTGMIAAALLFHLGRTEGETRLALATLRPLTAAEMGSARLDWARSFSPGEEGS